QGAGGQAESNNSATLTVTSSLARYPDLTVSNLVVEPAAGWAPGSAVTLRWRVNNTGNVDIVEDWSDGIQVRNLASNVVVYSGSHTTAPGTTLVAGGSIERSATITWPTDGNALGRFELSVSA